MLEDGSDLRQSCPLLKLVRQLERAFLICVPGEVLAHTWTESAQMLQLLLHSPGVGYG